MNKKKGVAGRLADVLSGKGFYIVLFLCVAVIGVSAWSLIFSPKSNMVDAPVSSVSDDPLAVFAPDDGDVAATPPTVNSGKKPAVSPVPSAPAATPSPTPNKPQDVSAQEEPDEDVAVISISDLTFVWPLSGNISATYSPDELVYNKTLADWRTHDGIDIAAQVGTKVMSVAEGTVESVSGDSLHGTMVVIYHADGVRSVYANLAATPTVKEGDSVSMGTVIGSVGDTTIIETGEVTHLHLEMTLDGAPVDPAEYLPKR